MKKTVILLALIALFGFGGNAFAVDEIDVNVSGDDSRMFNEDNIYPGWSKKKTVTVTNRSETSEVDLYMDFKIDNGKALSNELKIYVINSKGSYRIGGAGDKHTIKKADEEGTLFVEKLGVGESEKYTIKIKFDKDAGNDTQKKDTQFDIDFTIEGETTRGLTGSEILALQDRTVTGEAPADEVDENEEKSTQGLDVQKLSVGDGDTGRVAGAETCHSWPLWVWILIVVVYGGIAVMLSKNAITPQEKKNTLFWQIALAILSIALWYFFDTCRNYNWEPIITVIGGAVFITMMYKNKQNPQQQPPQNV